MHNWATYLKWLNTKFINVFNAFYQYVVWLMGGINISPKFAIMVKFK